MTLKSAKSAVQPVNLTVKPELDKQMWSFDSWGCSLKLQWEAAFIFSQHTTACVHARAFICTSAGCDFTLWLSVFVRSLHADMVLLQRSVCFRFFYFHFALFTWDSRASLIGNQLYIPPKPAWSSPNGIGGEKWKWCKATSCAKKKKDREGERGEKISSGKK